MSTLLIYGCGELAWARRFALGDGWDRGLLDDRVTLPAPGGTVAVSLADELDAEAGWTRRRSPPAPRVEVRRDSAAEGPLLPAWSELAASQAQRITGELSAAGTPDRGVLVAPDAWRRSPRGRQLLRAWGAAGWTWAPLEEVLRRQLGDTARWASSAGSWVRIREPEGSAVVANGAEAAAALELATAVVDRALAAVDGELAAAWRRREEAESGWFARQQIVRLATEALREGERSFEVGTLAVPLFLFSGAGERQRYRELAGLTLTVELPALSAANWWQQLATSDFPERPPGGPPALRWRDLETVLVEHPKASGARFETRFLQRYLRFNGLPQRTIDPSTLTGALDLGAEVERRLGPREAEETAAAAAPPPPPPDGPAPEAADPAADPLDGFRPDRLLVGEPHRPDHLRVWIDGEPVDPENVRPIELGRGRRGYRLDGPAVGHGAVVRIDYEPV